MLFQVNLIGKTKKILKIILKHFKTEKYGGINLFLIKKKNFIKAN